MRKLKNIYYTFLLKLIFAIIIENKLLDTYNAISIWIHGVLLKISKYFVKHVMYCLLVLKSIILNITFYFYSLPRKETIWSFDEFNRINFYRNLRRPPGEVGNLSIHETVFFMRLWCRLYLIKMYCTVNCLTSLKFCQVTKRGCHTLQYRTIDFAKISTLKI